MRYIIFAAMLSFLFGQVIAQPVSSKTSNSAESPNKVMFSNSGQKEFFNRNKTFEIKGHITGYSPDSNNRFITFRMNKIMGQMRDTSIQIDKQGNFRAVLYQPFEGNTSFYYSSGDGFIFNDLYMSPGTVISLSVDEKKVRAKDDSHVFESSGKFSQTNNLIAQFTLAMKSHQFRASEAWPDSKLSSDSMASYWNLRLKEELDFFHRYVTTKKITDPVFRSWQENKLMYWGGYRLMLSLFSGRMDTALTYEHFIAYFHEIPFDRKAALHNSNYYEFLGFLASGFEVVENVNRQYRDEQKRNGNDKYPLALKYADMTTNGIARDLVYANLFNAEHFSHSAYAHLFYAKNVKDEFIQSAISEVADRSSKPFETYDIVERLKSYKVDDSLKERLYGIFSGHKGKYLFVDFWGSWCGPCMAEMPIYPKFIHHFNTDSLQFLFVAFDMNQAGVDEVQKKYNIPGDFVLLTANEVRVLNNVLGFESYPQHFVVDPQGRMISKEITYISAGGEPAEYAIEKLDSLMKKAGK